MKSQPFQMNGKIYTPDKNGNVRVINKGVLDTLMAMREHERKAVDKLMGYAMAGDDICQFMFGLTASEWENLTKATNETNAEYNLSEELNNVDCSIKHIRSLLPSSLNQKQSIAKLRKIVEHHASSVSIECFKGQ